MLSPDQKSLRARCKNLLRRAYRGVRPNEEFPLPERPGAATQLALMQSYRQLAAVAPQKLPKLSEVGFRAFSQFEEDGILLYIFSLLGTTSRVCVEICAGNGTECNTTNLIINHGWWGHLFDGRERNVEAGKAFFGKHPDTYLYPPRFNHAWITAENVNDLISNSGAHGEIDLLSLDLDGVDYWIWKAITVIQPRVVVCEVHNPIPADKAITMPYQKDFIFESDDYRGASLAAMAKLGAVKGYRLVGVHRFGFNAFFIRDDIADPYFPAVSVASCLEDPFTLESRRTRWPAVSGHPWIQV